MTRQASLYHSRKRRVTAARVQSFSALISTPINFSAPIVLPASAEIGISFSAPVTAGQVSVATNTGRTLQCPALAANEIHKLGFFERATTLAVTASVAGNATLYVYDDWNRVYLIATGDPPA